MPRSSTVIIIRHAEKNRSTKSLSQQGLYRAHAYAEYFYQLNLDGDPFTPDHIFAAASTSKSIRPTETVQRLAHRLNIHIHNKFNENDAKGLVQHLSHSHFDGGQILICWRHEGALELAKEFGVKPHLLGANSGWPSTWNDKDYGTMLILRFDANGNVDVGRTYSLNQKLMATDIDDSLLLES